jgi:hypothetical protein
VLFVRYWHSWSPYCRVTGCRAILCR